MTNKICFATIIVDDISTATDFYTNALGFEARDVPHAPTVLPLWSDGIPIVLNQVADIPKEDGDDARIILGIETDDISARMGELKANGVTFTSDEPLKFPVGWRAEFKDPAGNSLELIQWD